MADAWFSYNDCTAWLPPAFCRYRDVLLYLAPSALLALLIQVLSRLHPVFFLFRLAGTTCHELAHFMVGFITGARPQSLTVIPRRSGRDWHLGSVMFSNVCWYNAAPAALAPFLILLIPLAVALWRTRDGLHFEVFDVALALLLAPQFISCWPSWVDWKISLRSWPYPLIGALAWWLIHTDFHTRS